MGNKKFKAHWFFLSFLPFLVLGLPWSEGRGEELSEYTWYDGETPRKIYLKNDWVVDFSQEGKDSSGDEESIGRTKSLNTSSLEPSETPEVVRRYFGVKVLKKERNSVKRQSSLDLTHSSSSNSSEKLSPAFLSTPEGGEVMALPGGILVTFEASLSFEEIKTFAREKNLILEKRLPLANHQIWLVQSPSGIESLELANSLRQETQVKAASPNWWRALDLR